MPKQSSLKVLGQRIREMRKKKGFSQEELALEAGIDRSYMGGIERGERNPSINVLFIIAKTLKTDVASLTHGLPFVTVD